MAAEGGTIERARTVYDKSGWRGVAGRIVRMLRRLSEPLARRSRRRRAEAERERIVTFNDFFFAELGVERQAALDLHDDICRRCDILARPTESRQRLFFAALKLSGFAPRAILEIGTEHGETAQFLGELFPGTQITTVNLPTDDPIFAAWHPEGDATHLETVATRLTAPNIDELRANTLWLGAQDLPIFDLIWLDGGHAYPEVAWDHFYCLHRLAPGGWLFSDDICLPKGRRVRQDPANGHTHDVITYINARLDPGFRLLLKRDAVSEPLADAKYISVLHKAADDAS